MGAITDQATNPITGETPGKTPKKLSLVAERRIEAATHAFDLESDKNVLLYLSVVLAQCGLPYTDPGESCPLYTRDNGRVALSITRGSIMNPHSRQFEMQGYPFGTRPRLLMLYFCTEAVKLKRRELYIGDTLNDFMRNLGIAPKYGENGSIGRLQEQIKRLFASHMRFYFTHPDTEEIKSHMTMVNGVPLLSQFDIWFPQGIHDVAKWNGAVVISQDIFDRLKAGCMPVRQIDVLALQNSPMALDVYTWLAYSNFTMRTTKSKVISWEKLRYQFGPEYSEVRQFRARFTDCLSEVHKIYPSARFEVDPKTGLILHKSPTPVARKYFPAS